MAEITILDPVRGNTQSHQFEDGSSPSIATIRDARGLPEGTSFFLTNNGMNEPVNDSFAVQPGQQFTAVRQHKAGLAN